MKRLLSVVALLGATFGVAEAQSDAFRFNFAGDQIIIDRESNWRNWIYQNSFVREVSSPMDSTGLFDFTFLGVKPKYFAATQNHVLGRDEFSYVDDVRFRGLTVTVQGQIQALSNDEIASRVGAGDDRQSVG